MKLGKFRKLNMLRDYKSKGQISGDGHVPTTSWAWTIKCFESFGFLLQKKPLHAG